MVKRQIMIFFSWVIFIPGCLFFALGVSYEYLAYSFRVGQAKVKRVTGE